MLKTIFKQVEKVLKGRLSKSALQEELSKHPNYLAKAKEIWSMINEDLGISDTVENKLVSKLDKFEKAVISKFPELTRDDVIELRQSIVGEINAGKDAVLSQVETFKQLQDFNNKLQEEIIELKNKLSKFESTVTSKTVAISDETAKITTKEDPKKENI